MRSLFFAMFLLWGLASATIIANGTNQTYYISSAECYQDAASGNMFCVQQTPSEIVLNSTSDRYYTLDNKTVRFGGYPPVMEYPTCGQSYNNTERGVYILSSPLKYNRIDTINPLGSVFYPDINLTCQADGCPVCNSTIITYNNTNCTVNTTVEGLHNYTGSIACGSSLNNTDYNVFINTTPANIGTDYLNPSQVKSYPACGLIAVCQAPLPTVCENCSNFDAMRLRFGCIGERQLTNGECTDACGIHVCATSVAVEYKNISSGETTTNLEKGYSVSCNNYDCEDAARESLNLTEINCTNITLPSGEIICFELWKSTCSNEQIFAGEAGINQCFLGLINGCNQNTQTCQGNLATMTTDYNECDRKSKEDSDMLIFMLGLITIMVVYYVIPIFLEWHAKGKKKIPKDEA